MATKIHSTAVVHKSAQLDENVEIAPYAVIGPDVRIGAGTFVGPHSIVEFSEIGKNNNITGNACLGTAPQDYSYHGEATRLVIGDGNIIREGVSLHRGSPATKITTIGSGCMFMASSHVGHDCHVGNNVILVNCTGLSGHVHIEDKVIVSGLSGVHQFTRIGTMAMVGAGSMVNLDVLPYCRAQGDRAKLVGLNSVGLRRAGFSRETIKAIKDVYKILFFRGLRLEEAVAQLKNTPLPPEAMKMVEFCAKSKRGFARPRMLARREASPSDDE